MKRRQSYPAQGDLLKMLCAGCPPSSRPAILQHSKDLCCSITVLQCKNKCVAIGWFHQPFFLLISFPPASEHHRSTLVQPAAHHCFLVVQDHASGVLQQGAPPLLPPKQPGLAACEGCTGLPHPNQKRPPRRVLMQLPSFCLGQKRPFALNPQQGLEALQHSHSPLMHRKPMRDIDHTINQGHSILRGKGHGEDGCGCMWRDWKTIERKEFQGSLWSVMHSLMLLNKKPHVPFVQEKKKKKVN